MFINEIIHKICDTQEKLMFDSFSKYGYSKEWLLDPDHSHRVRVEVYQSFETFCVDDIALFQITTSYRQSDTDPYDIKVGVNVQYIAPLPEEDKNEN